MCTCVCFFCSHNLHSIFFFFLDYVPLASEMCVYGSGSVVIAVAACESNPNSACVPGVPRPPPPTPACCPPSPAACRRPSACPGRAPPSPTTTTSAPSWPPCRSTATPRALQVVPSGRPAPPPSPVPAPCPSPRPCPLPPQPSLSPPTPPPSATPVPL